MVLRYFGAIGRRWPERGNVRGQKANRGVESESRGGHTIQNQDVFVFDGAG